MTDMESTAYRPPMPPQIRELVLESHGERLNAVMKASYCAGWTLQELADIAGITRERVRQRTNYKVSISVMSEVEKLIPQKPAKPAKPSPAPAAPKAIDLVPAAVLAAIKDLQQKASGVNGATPIGDPRRAYGDALCGLVKSVMDEYSVSPGALSRAIGLSSGTLGNRLAARDIIPRPPSLPQYKNATAGRRRKSATCKRGHDTSFPEARYGGTGNCKECTRLRYRSKAEAA